MEKRSISDTISLANSIKIPQLGFGVYQSPTNVCVKSCLTALESSYRHIDTAQYYGNEEEVGRAVMRSGLQRKDVFLTTKILTAGGSVELSYAKCVDSIKKLDSEDGYLHPWLQQRGIVEYCNNHGIVVEAYCPLVRNTKAEDKTLVGIAEKHGVTPSRVLIRYCLQKNWVPLPKSDNPGRIRANADVFSFDLDQEDMRTLDNLDQGPTGAIVQAVDND
ncbi:hypothetical protein ACJZ2D_006759 [Fusarium nematophilum]